jgi:hypothetical protein
LRTSLPHGKRRNIRAPKRPVAGAASTISNLPREAARLSALIAIAAFLRYSASLSYLGLV